MQARLALIALVCLAASVFGGYNKALGREDREDKQAAEALQTIFQASRHPATVDTSGPYRVEIKQIRGLIPREGRLLYTIRRNGIVTESEVALKPSVEGKNWSAEIPGQPAGTEVFYHFAFDLLSGGVTLHPRRAPQAHYRFRIVPMQLKALSIPLRPSARSQGTHIAAVLDALTQPQGALHYRIRPGEFIAKAPLAVRDTQPGIYEISATIPPQPIGTVVGLYFEITVDGSPPTSIPADAPSRFLSYKVSSPKLSVMTGGGQVAALAIAEDRLLVGLEGGGLLEARPEAVVPIRRTVADGLLSSAIRSLAADAVAGVYYVGTRNGVIAFRLSGGSPEPVAWPPFHQQGDPVFNQLGTLRDGNLSVVSELDGTFVFQLKASEPVHEQSHREALLLQLVDDRLSGLQLQTKSGHILGLSAATYDEIDGCFIFGATLGTAEGTAQPALVRRCGETVEVISITSLPVSGETVIPLHVEAIGRDPGSRELVIAIRYSAHRNDSAQRYSYSGVFGLCGDTLFPLAPGLVDLVPSVTALLADWSAGRLLVATYGQGLLVLRQGSVSKIGQMQGLPSAEVTATITSQDTAEILVGTSRGLARLRGEVATSLYPEALDETPIRPDMVPLDQLPQSRRLLLGSTTGGLAVLQAEADGSYKVIRTLKAGRDLPPAGIYGEAVFDPQRQVIWAALPSKGLLRIEGSETKLLTTAQGLKRNDIWHILLHPRTGLLWLVFPPLPSGYGLGGGIQFHDGTTGGSFVPLRDQTLATLGDLLFVPDRRTVFAAGFAGVLEFHDDGRFERRSVNPVSALDRDPRNGMVVAVGTAIERWDGQRFYPVLFLTIHPRVPTGQFALRPAKDIAIDSHGKWHILFPDGFLITMDSGGQFSQLLDFEDGLPRSAQKLLYFAPSHTLVVGTSEEGLVFLKNP